MENVTNFPYEKNGYYPILPLVYDDALSYLETLNKVSAKLNEVIDALNEASSKTLDEAKAYTDEKIAEQIVFINEAVDEVRILKSELESSNEAFIKSVNARLTMTDNKVDTFNTKLEANVREVNARTDLAIEQNNDYIFSHLSSELAKIKVVNFFTGEQISVQNMFDYLASLHTENSIKVSDFSELNRTVDYLVALRMTMTDMVLRGGTLIR